MPSTRPCADPDAGLASIELEPGMILVSPTGQVRIIRSRTGADGGWNCSDGAALDDADICIPGAWSAYSHEELVAELRLAREVGQISGHRALSGGLATWDACSGRPCVLPKLARMVH